MHRTANDYLSMEEQRVPGDEAKTTILALLFRHEAAVPPTAYVQYPVRNLPTHLLTSASSSHSCAMRDQRCWHGKARQGEVRRACPSTSSTDEARAAWSAAERARGGIRACRSEPGRSRVM